MAEIDIPPTKEAIKTAEEFSSQLHSANLPPDLITSSAEGGVGIVFLKDSKQADIEIFNDGEIYASLFSPEHETKVWEVVPSELQDTIAKIREFLRP